MKQRSLLRHLLAWVLGSLVLVWASYMAVGWQTGVHEAEELTDGHLASVASLLLSQRSTEFVTPRANAGLLGATALRSHDYQQSLSVVVWDAHGHLLSRTGDAPLPTFDASEGFATLPLGQPALPWRAFSRWDGPEHGRKVMVLLSEHERDELAWDIAEQVATPGLWVLPVVALVLGLAIWRGLRPLAALSRDVSAMDVQAAHPLPEPARPRHEEFRAVVEAIDALVQRSHAALTRERQLAGELAHELRTPLAALALHADALQGELTPAERTQALAHLKHDAMHAGEVMRHLLALARASHAELAETAQPLDLAELAARVLGSYAQPALDAGHELALQSEGPFEMRGHPVLLEIALRNLIENALAHAPSGATIELQLNAAERWVQVCDDGGVGNTTAAAGAPGTPPPHWGLGLGLGRRVVEKVAALHNARLEQRPSPTGPGRCDRLSLG